MKNKKIKLLQKMHLLLNCADALKVDPKDEARSIGICTDSVVTKKGLRISGFSCKKGPKLKRNRKQKSHYLNWEKGSK